MKQTKIKTGTSILKIKKIDNDYFEVSGETFGKWVLNGEFSRRQLIIFNKKLKLLLKND